MKKEEMLEEINVLLENQHHNIRINDDIKWYSKMNKKYNEDEINEVDMYFRNELISDFAERIEKKLGLGVIQLGRSGASLCIDAYSHNDGYHLLDIGYGWYENGTRSHWQCSVDEDSGYKNVLEVLRKLRRYEKEIELLMKKYYDGEGLGLAMYDAGVKFK